MELTVLQKKFQTTIKRLKKKDNKAFEEYALDNFHRIISEIQNHSERITPEIYTIPFTISIGNYTAYGSNLWSYTSRNKPEDLKVVLAHFISCMYMNFHLTKIRLDDVGRGKWPGSISSITNESLLFQTAGWFDVAKDYLETFLKHDKGKALMEVSFVSLFVALSTLDNELLKKYSNHEMIHWLSGSLEEFEKKTGSYYNWTDKKWQKSKFFSDKHQFNIGYNRIKERAIHSKMPLGVLLEQWDSTNVTKA